jgi:hypothetical protein
LPFLNPEYLGQYAFGSAFISLGLNFVVRRSRRQKMTRGIAIEKVIMGANAPTFMFLALSPFQPSLLTKIADQPNYLVTAGIIGLVLCYYTVIDDNS